MKTSKKPAQILGLERMKLTPKSCRERAATLRRKVEAGRFKGETASLALRWASWYKAKANQLSGTSAPRPRKAATRKAPRKAPKRRALTFKKPPQDQPIQQIDHSAAEDAAAAVVNSPEFQAKVEAMAQEMAAKKVAGGAV